MTFGVPAGAAAGAEVPVPLSSAPVPPALGAAGVALGVGGVVVFEPAVLGAGAADGPPAGLEGVDSEPPPSLGMPKMLLDLGFIWLLMIQAG